MLGVVHGRRALPLRWLTLFAALSCCAAAAEAPPFRPVYAGQYGSFPEELLSQSIANLGKSWRTRRVLNRLREGEPITVLALGGSVTNRMAGCTDALVECKDGRTCCGMFETHDATDAGQGFATPGAGWARLFVDWMQAAYTPSGGRNHTLFNAGVSASGNEPEPYLMCWLNRLPHHFDIVLLDFRVSRSYMLPAPPESSLEHLIRRLLTWNGQAPVVMLNIAFDWCHQPEWAQHVEVNFATNNHLCRAHPALDHYLTSLYTPFPVLGGGYEDSAHVLAAYYNLPQVSMRNALFTWLASNTTGVAASWNMSTMLNGMGDGVHPAPMMQHAWAESLIHWWRVIAVMHDSFDSTPAAARLLPKLPAMVQPISHLTYACYSSKDGGLQRLNLTMQQFNWSDYSHNGEKRFGFVANQSGAWIAVSMNTTLHATAEDHETRDPFVGIELIHTADTGATAAATALVTCTQGCTCTPAETRIDTRADSHSLPQTTAVQVTQSPACTVRIAVDGPGRLVFTGITLGETYDGTTPVHSAPVSGFHHDTVFANNPIG